MIGTTAATIGRNTGNPQSYPYRQNVLSYGANLLRYWDMGLAPGGAIIPDIGPAKDVSMGSTAGLRGALAGKPGLVSSDPTPCYDFLGTNQYFANSTNTTGLDVTPITVECWFVADNQTGVLCSRALATGGPWMLWLNLGVLQFRFWTVAGGTGTSFNATGSTPLSIDGVTKYYAAATYDGTDAKVYVNSVLDGQTNQPGVLRAGGVGLGAYLGIRGDGTAPFNGRAGQFAIYSGAQGPADFATRYALGA